ncbi:DNA-binding transcriptional regulator, LysR family [Leifsonia sp. 98AMF]|uniref:LysR family transcriptional regulator n=1 Tax=unclassified Leifsonia TaxID=2663824 RepID=UPI00087A627F|nr:MULTISPECIES: LysR family transcriptional regulator [unclassified Leifsonia]SDH02652.1 DNA-binding transcriptional regulator, LysR family [Leifsonia sp. 197AMF]SDJ38749.1 DNA-binding transcriptional regulator, LysR family [Leifsonia sp. 466MF]SDK40121.1 DNA-binding transcriptional regulator, LysR family [Leifsonia sp. 157MF]SDN58949.1 DNA-binding transcriptional regulator, LysR family [Leifsonia sp. 509MF]SEN50384.1 DNA-binding transcriptional regulator, LysR family [Leifsonia sp. 467MF]
MELRQLEHFVTVAEERHFTRAAELLRISQSGLSASIRSLEQELGTSLFIRSTRRVELTAAGQALLADSVRTLASAAAARDAVAAVRGLLRGRLTIGAEPCLGSVDLPAELAAFRTANPGVEVRLRYSGSEELVDDVAGGRADVALVVDTGHTPAGVHLRPLSTQQMLVLCHPDHPFAAEQSIPLDALRGEPLVGFQEGWGAQALSRRAFAASGFDYRAAMEVNDVHPLLDLVGYNLGVAVVPESFARKRPDALRAVRLQDAPVWTVAVAVAEQPSPAASAFLTQLDPVALTPAPATAAAGS